MTRSDEVWVCLKCFNSWRSSSQKGKPQCSNKDCMSRLTVRYADLEHAITHLQRSIKSLPYPAGDLFAFPDPINFVNLLGSGWKLLDQADPRFPDGVKTLNKLLVLAQEWEPENEDLDEALERVRDSKEF